MARQQQLIDHVQDHQGGHAVVREAFPRLCGGQVVEALGLPENPARRRAAFANHRCHAALSLTGPTLRIAYRGPHSIGISAVFLTVRRGEKRRLWSSRISTSAPPSA